MSKRERKEAKLLGRLFVRTDTNLRAIVGAILDEGTGKPKNIMDSPLAVTAFAGAMLADIYNLIANGKLKRAEKLLDMTDKEYKVETKQKALNNVSDDLKAAIDKATGGKSTVVAGTAESVSEMVEQILAAINKGK